jgi:hypothetical protein
MAPFPDRCDTDPTYDLTSITLALALLGVGCGVGLATVGRRNLERYREFSTKEDLINHLEANEVVSPWAGAVIGVAPLAGVYWLTVGAASLTRSAAVFLQQ